MPQVKVKVHNSSSDEMIFLDVFEFVKAHALLKDEVAFLKNAITNNRDYTSPAAHDPITLLFDNSFHVCIYINILYIFIHRYLFYFEYE